MEFPLNTEAEGSLFIRPALELAQTKGLAVTLQSRLRRLRWLLLQLSSHLPIPHSQLSCSPLTPNPFFTLVISKHFASPRALEVGRSKRHKRKGTEERFFVTSKGISFEGEKLGLINIREKLDSLKTTW